MSNYYKYTMDRAEVPDDFIVTLGVGDKVLTLGFTWPSYIEEEVANINTAAETRMKSMGLEDGTQEYNFFNYWASVLAYLETHTIREWIDDATKVHPETLKQLSSPDDEDWVAEQVAFYLGCIEMLAFYNELLVWDIRVSSDKDTIHCAGNLGGWTQFPDETFAFRLASKSKTNIGRDDLPYMTIYFEVY